MFGKNKKKKKDKKPLERFVSLTANGEAVSAINFALTKDESGEPRLEVRTPDVAPQLHYESIDFELKTTVKMVRVKATFKEAKSEKHFKLYIFDIEDYSQFFI